MSPKHLINSHASMSIPSDLPPEFEAAIRKYVASRFKLWSLFVGIPSLLVLLIGAAMLMEARRLGADVVRFGMPLEIYNRSWGTVIDGVNPGRWPSDDPIDVRRGAKLQQFLPLYNDEQLWELRRRQPPSASAETPAPPALDPLPK